MSDRLPNRVTISPNALFQEVEGEGVVLNLTTERYFGLEGSAARMWQLLAEHGDPERASAELVREFAVDEATLRTDLARLIDELAAAGLLSIDTDAPANAS